MVATIATICGPPYQVEYDALQSYLVTSRFPDDYTKDQKDALKEKQRAF